MVSFVDLFTGYVILEPIVLADAITVARKLHDSVVMVFGVPNCYLTDNGVQYKNALSEHLCKFYGINKLFTSPYHPISNGACEVANKTVKEALAIYARGYESDWHKWLKTCQARLNFTERESRGFSPYELLFGYKPRIGEAHNYAIMESIPFGNWHDYLCDLRIHLKDLRQESTVNYVNAQLKWCEKADKKAKNRLFIVGDYCYVHSPTKKRGIPKKLGFRFNGLYKIVECRPNNLFLVKDVNTGKVLKSPIHINRLKEYHESNLGEPIDRMADGSTKEIIDIRPHRGKKDTVQVRYTTDVNERPTITPISAIRVLSH